MKVWKRILSGPYRSLLRFSSQNAPTSEAYHLPLKSKRVDLAEGPGLKDFIKASTESFQHVENIEVPVIPYLKNVQYSGFNKKGNFLFRCNLATKFQLFVCNIYLFFSQI